MHKFANYLYALVGSYIFLLIASFFFGLLFGSSLEILSVGAPYFLGAIFFLSALKIDLREIGKYMREKTLLLLVNGFMLIALPVFVYFLFQWISPSLAIPFMILAAMPCGMTSPLIVEMCGGKQSLALVLTVTSSLLAPLTIPFVIKALAGAEVAVSFSAMFLSLVKVIFVPFLLAEAVKAFAKKKALQRLFPAFKPISIFLLSLLITGIIAKQRAMLRSLFAPDVLATVLLLYALFIAFHFFGYYLLYWRKRAERITSMICIAYMNFTLAIYLAYEFFPDPKIVIPVVLSVLPWSTLLGVLQYGMYKRRIVNI